MVKNDIEDLNTTAKMSQAFFLSKRAYQTPRLSIPTIPASTSTPVPAIICPPHIRRRRHTMRLPTHCTETSQSTAPHTSTNMFTYLVYSASTLQPTDPSRAETCR